jgi:hypothetical protein
MWLVTILSLILCSTIFYLSYSRLNSNCDLYANMQEIQKSRVNDFWLLILKLQLNKWNKRTEFSFLPSKLKLDTKYIKKNDTHTHTPIYNWNSKLIIELCINNPISGGKWKHSFIIRGKKVSNNWSKREKNHMSIE